MRGCHLEVQSMLALPGGLWSDGLLLSRPPSPNIPAAVRTGLLQFLLCAARRCSWFHDSAVSAGMCSPDWALTRFAQKSTLQKDGSGHHTSYTTQITEDESFP